MTALVAHLAAWPRLPLLSRVAVWALRAIIALLVFRTVERLAASVATAAATTDPHVAGKALILVEQVLLHMIPALVLAGIVFRRLTPSLFGLIVFTGFLTHHIGLYDFRLHGFLLSNDLYPASFYGHGGKATPNPQYAKLMVDAALIAALLGLFLTGLLAPALARRVRLPAGLSRAALWTERFRSIDRFFILLITASVLLTTFIFHRVVAEAALDDVKGHNQALMETVLDMSRQDRDRVCRLRGYDCYVMPVDEVFARHSEIINRQVRDVHGTVTRDSRIRKARHSWAGAASLIDDELRAFQITYGLDGDHYQVVIDTKFLRRATDRHQAFYCWLAIAAHGVWLFLGTSVLFFHHWRLGVWRGGRRPRREAAVRT